MLIDFNVYHPEVSELLDKPIFLQSITAIEAVYLEQRTANEL